MFRSGNVTQVRHFSRRRIAYPFYLAKKLGKTNPKEHDTNLKYQMRQFLGPKNYKGEYTFNRYFKVPENHTPKYITPEIERGECLVDPVTGQSVKLNTNSMRVEPSTTRDEQASRRQRRELQPFPENVHCRTNVNLSDELKEEICQKIASGASTQEVAQQYKLQIPRIEAIVKLNEIEKKWESNNRITEDMRTMTSTLYKMFPLYDAEVHRENLSEIPVPSKSLRARFLSIAESEPFGPVEAAKVFELEPASETLSKLSEIGEHSAHHEMLVGAKKEKVVYGEVAKGDKAVFRFTSAKVGQVGVRYGAGNRDNKKDRRVAFEMGRMVYV